MFHLKNERISTEAHIQFSELNGKYAAIVRENEELKKLLEKEIEKNALKTKSIFGRKTEGFPALLDALDNLEEDDVFSCVKSEAPRPLISHSMASPSAVAYVIYQKCLNFLPFYRMEQDFRRMSVPVGRETLANWVTTCALTFLEPLYCLLFLEQKQREILHGDETPCQVLHEKDREATAKSYIWLIVTGEDGLAPVITYHYSPSRGHEVPEGLLGDFKGYFHTDKYDGYNCLEGHVVRCLC